MILRMLTVYFKVIDELIFSSGFVELCAIVSKRIPYRQVVGSVSNIDKLWTMNISA